MQTPSISFSKRVDFVTDHVDTAIRWMSNQVNLVSALVDLIRELPSSAAHELYTLTVIGLTYIDSDLLGDKAEPYVLSLTRSWDHLYIVVVSDPSNLNYLTNLEKLRQKWDSNPRRLVPTHYETYWITCPTPLTARPSCHESECKLRP